MLSWWAANGVLGSDGHRRLVHSPQVANMLPEGFGLEKDENYALTYRYMTSLSRIQKLLKIGNHVSLPKLNDGNPGSFDRDMRCSPSQTVSKVGFA